MAKSSASSTETTTNVEGVRAPPASSSEKPPALSHEPGEVEDEYPGFRKTLPILLCVYCALFLVGLDRTILATAVPRITDEFNSLGDVGWYGSSYLLTSASFQLMFGKIYTFYNTKWTFLLSIVIFEIGSAVCGAAPSSTVFIVGRALAGVGAAGIFSGAMMITFQVSPLRKRPLLQGVMGSIMGICAILGPLIGGALTDKVTWRWCFYLNLPIAGAALVVLPFFLNLPAPVQASASFRERIDQLDPLGNLCLIPGIICLLLALQWGGTKYAWNDGHIIALLVVFGILVIAFIAVQIWKQESATIPPRIFKMRSMFFGFVFSLTIGASMFVIIYFLPIYFQAIQGVTPVESGIRNLPMLIPLILSSIIAAVCITKFGYYTPFMIVGSTIFTIGGGLITTFDVDTTNGKWIGYQIVFGFGLGMCMQLATLAAQTILPKKDVSIGSTLMFFGVTLGGAIFTSVGENIFTNKLVQGLSGIAGFNPTTVVQAGATRLRDAVSPEDLPAVLSAYMAAIRSTLYVVVGMGCLGFVCSCFMEWKSVRAEQRSAPAPLEESKV